MRLVSLMLSLLIAGCTSALSPACDNPRNMSCMSAPEIERALSEPLQ